MTNPTTVYVIFSDTEDFPKRPSYEGTDIVQAAKTVIAAADLGKRIAIRVRWKGKLIYGLPADAHALADEIKKQRRIGS